MSKTEDVKYIKKVNDPIDPKLLEEMDPEEDMTNKSEFDGQMPVINKELEVPVWQFIKKVVN